MGIVRDLLGPRREAANSFLDDAPPYSSLLEAFFGANTEAGKVVRFETAIRLTTVYACWRLLGDMIGSLPIVVYEELEDGTRRRARDAWQWKLLHDAPNADDVAVSVWGDVTGHLNEDGNTFLGKQFDMVRTRPRVTGLWPTHPQRIRIGRHKDGRKLYWLKDANGVEEREPYTDAEIIHVRGMARKGARGISPLSAAREAIGAGLALEEYMNRFWPNSAVPGGVLETQKELSDPAIARLRRRWQRNYGGPRNAARVAILEEGMTFKPVALSQKDAQFIEQHGLSVAQIARIYRVPLSLIAAEATNASLTYRTLEQDNLQFLTYSLRPWMVRIEQPLRSDPDLFPPDEPFVPEFLSDALLRTDLLTRYKAHQISTGGKPWKWPSEVRRIENDPPDDELDELARQTPALPPVPDDENDEDEDDDRR